MRVLLSLAIIIGVATGQQYFKEPEKLVSESRAAGDNPGSYAFAYETEGGIVQREQGTRKYAGTADEAQLIQGSVQYNAPDGTPISYSWTADEFGTQVSGSHIPTPPPIPPEIQRALDWLAKQPSTTEEPEQSGDYSSRNIIARDVQQQQPQSSSSSALPQQQQQPPQRPFGLPKRSVRRY